jgi:drug/metabolite transporter (DMT)-like permease
VLPIALAFTCALVWGSADYCGGRASTRGDALGVTVVSQLFSLPVLVISVLLLPGHLRLADLGWGAGAGAAGLFGIVLLYRGLAAGRMAIVAPVTAVTGALVPIAFGLLTGDRPGALPLTGALCAVVAIGLVSLSPGHPGEPRRASTGSIVGLALAAGTFFGIFFVLIAQAGHDAGVWPLVGARSFSVVLGLALVLRARVPLRPARALLPWMAVAGIGDITANALYLLATRDGILSIIAPIAALYPVSTVLLAVTVDKERVRATQLVGLGLAATALVLTAV